MTVSHQRAPTRTDRRTRRYALPEHQWIVCAVCGASDTRAVYVKFDLVIGRCRRCGLVYSNPRAALSDISKRYGREYFWNEYLPALGVGDGRVDLEVFDRHYWPMLQLLRREAPPPSRLLEVGAAAGLFLKAAARAGWDVVGIELSGEAAQFARRLGLDVRQERAEQMSVEPQSIDVAVMFDTIEHLLDPMAVLQAVHGALRPRGTLVVTTPNFDALSRLALGRDWAVISPAEHLYYFTERTLGALLERAGFGGVRFERDFALGPLETMNPRASHDPRSWRGAVFTDFVETLGPSIYEYVQDRGRADQLVCLARA